MARKTTTRSLRQGLETEVAVMEAADTRPTLVGKTIAAARPMTREEMNALCWFPSHGEMPMVLVLNDGTLLIPQRDPEGNGPGMLLAMGARSVPTADPTRREVERFVDLVWTDGKVGHPGRTA